MSSLSEYMITRLMDILCQSTSDSIPVLYNLFSIEYQHLQEDVSQVYTNAELCRVKYDIDMYQFHNVIYNLSLARTVQYELEPVD